MLEVERRVPVDRIGLAVSGGGDSVALMLLAAEWARRTGAHLQTVTVDHGLRPEVAEEAALVGRLARTRGLSHDALFWRGWDGQGNLQDAARHARRRLIGAWAAEAGLPLILTGHTRDDQAETVLLRLARGSGVDGLAGIRPLSRWDNLVWARPLLGHGRAELREWLRGRGVTWAEDPSNEDPTFDRVKARKLLAGLSDLGLTAQRLAATADRMRAAGTALDAAADAFAADHVTQDRGDLLIDRGAFLRETEDLTTRLMAAALQWVSGAPYRPRYAALQGLLRDCAEGRGGTLHGCLVRIQGRDGMRVLREPKAVEAITAAPGSLWDGRWRLDGPWQPGDRIAATGKALFDLPNWRDAGLPQDSLMAAPAVWRDNSLVAAPLAGFSQEFVAYLATGRDHFTVGAELH